jgi:hypothetical protein
MINLSKDKTENLSKQVWIEVNYDQSYSRNLKDTLTEYLSKGFTYYNIIPLDDSNYKCIIIFNKPIMKKKVIRKKKKPYEINYDNVV